MIRLLTLLCLAVVLLAGCSWNSAKETVVDSWHATKDFVDPAPEIDTNEYQFENPNQEKLAKLLTPVDGPLLSLSNYVMDKDTLPDQEWIDLLFVRFPWVHRVFVTDKIGNVLTQKPEVPIKRFSQPLVFSAVWRETFLKPVADYPELGPELYLGTPYFKDINFVGLIVAGFDPRTLLNMSPHPEQLLVIHPGGQVWSVQPCEDAAALLAVNWEELVSDEVYGQVEANGKYYTWLARFIGQDYFIYATESVDPKADNFSIWPF